MCDCKNVVTGSYDNQICVKSPPHMPKSNGYCLDSCVSVEVKWLWYSYGITTTGCCCGHNSQDGFIGVIDSDINKMKELDYEVRFNPLRPTDQDSFYPKSVNRMVAS